MTLGYVLLQNLKRNPLRSGLTIAAFALPMAIFVVALSFVVQLARIAEANERELRLAVRQRISLTNYLPDGMRRKIEAIDPAGERIRAVCGMRWFGGRVPETQEMLTNLAADADTFPTVYSDVGMTPAEIEAWNRDRRAAVTGAGPANRHGWKVGDRVVLRSTVPPFTELEFVIVKIVQESRWGNFFWFRRDYLVESLQDSAIPAETVNIFWVKCTSTAAMRSVQAELETLFDNTPDPVACEDENTFASQFTQAAGDIPGLLQAMAVVVVFIIALVAGNTMMMSFRERMRELAVFKAIGFQAGRISLVVLGESVTLALIGGALGVVPTTLVLTFFPPRDLAFGPITTLAASPTAAAGSMLIALVVGVLAGLWPTWQARRLRATDALRRVA